MAEDLLTAARRAGASGGRFQAAARQFELGLAAVERDNDHVAVVHFGNSLKLAANTITFDVALFEENIEAQLTGETVGHAFSIAYQGQLYQGGESAGLARTDADAPETGQSPNKEMHVASVSKTLTAIVTLHALEEKGLTPDAYIAPYLPSNWTLGAGVADLKFRHFLTHTSGFGQINAGNSYEALRTAIETDVISQSSSYKNANFGLMRVLVAGLLGLDPVDYQEFESGPLVSAMFLFYAQSIFEPIGVNIDCASDDDLPTVQYNFPDTGDSGYTEPSRRLTCGGIGWFISSNELAAVMSHLRNTEDLLSVEMRETMQDDFLGLMGPGDYSGNLGAVGDFGVYYMHGGDWIHTTGEAHACVVAFPITVEASVVINSDRGDTDYQCKVLSSAFDDAWVPN